jgi:hypothetical protein
LKNRETIIVTLVSALSGFLARKVLHITWEGLASKKPPKNPDDPTVDWTEAVMWTAIASLFAGLFRLVARRETHNAFQGKFNDIVDKVKN